MTKNSTNLSSTVNADGFTMRGGTTERSLTVTGGDVDINGGGAATITFPSVAGTLATLVLEENIPHLLDAALSADGKFSGICENGTAGATLAFGDLCYFAVADSRWELADASAIATGGHKLGICTLAAAADASATQMLLWGKIRADAAFPDLTVGAPVYMSETAGDVTVTAPTTTDSVTRVLGFGNTANELFFCPSNDYYTSI